MVLRHKSPRETETVAADADARPVGHAEGGARVQRVNVERAATQNTTVCIYYRQFVFLIVTYSLSLRIPLVALLTPRIHVSLNVE